MSNKNILAGNHIHHKDGDVQNNELTNLESLSPHEHKLRHNQLRTHTGVRANELCGKVFERTAKKHVKYCSAVCCRRVADREYRARLRVGTRIWSC